jgi:hypothetical protein
VTIDPASTTLEELLGDQPLSDAQLHELWESLTGWSATDHPDAWELCEDAVLGALEPDRALQMRPGGWIVDLSSTVVRSAVAAALIGGAMWPAGLDQLPGFVLPAVLPMLFDIRRARLTRQDRRLLVDLRLRTTAQQVDWPWPPAAMYQRLPAAVQQSVSEDDFADFVQRLVAVGEADPAGYGEVRLRPGGQPAWLRITVD